MDLAEVLAAAGRTDEAIEAFEHALERYERKKNLAMGCAGAAKARGAPRSCVRLTTTDESSLEKSWKAAPANNGGSVSSLAARNALS